MTLRCVICEQTAPAVGLEEIEVHSNVRAFQDEKFAVWRCDRCQSIHARDDVDLAHYYDKYPFFSLPDDWRMHVMYENQLRRLMRAGLRRTHRILDYGCGSGAFVRYLKWRGFKDAVGYDEYSKDFSEAGVLAASFDCVVSQDVLEHVADPQALLNRFCRLTDPVGMVAVGTPNAAAIDLRRPGAYRHALHAPYHRHILSKQALIEAGKRRGLEVERYYPTQYGNTFLPFLNSTFYLYYAWIADNTLDVFTEPPRILWLIALLPLTLFLGLFGGLLARETDIMVIFRRAR